MDGEGVAGKPDERSGSGGGGDLCGAGGRDFRHDDVAGAVGAGEGGSGFSLCGDILRGKRRGRVSAEDPQDVERLLSAGLYVFGARRGGSGIF